MAAPLTGGDEARMLEDALIEVRQQTHLMRKCLETPGKLMDALKCASNLVSALRASSLGPKQYYELYMSVFDALQHLTMYLRDSHPHSHIGDLYELVQYAGNIVPRLYLMVTVGTVYMTLEDAPVREIMKDMMEMSRGVQHPTRGLFLRYYLSQKARDYLPTTMEDGPEGNLQDSINFILTNFVEMNKLWVRLQHQGHSSDRMKRVQERRELQQLVGSNLVRLSQLVDLDTYRNGILEPLLEQVVQCRDVLAQEYLLEVITQVFPDEYHLHTLDKLLRAISRLVPQVNLRNIVIGIMNRLSNYAVQESNNQPASVETRKAKEGEAVTQLMEKLKLSEEQTAKKTNGTSAEDTASESTKVDGELSNVSSTTAVHQLDSSTNTSSENTPDIRENSDPNATAVENIRLFDIFFSEVAHLINSQKLIIEDQMALLVALANLSLNTYPDRLDYLNQVLGFASQIAIHNANEPDLHSPRTQTHVLALLNAPVNAFVSIFTVLALPNYVVLLKAQPYPTRKAVASQFAQTIVSSQTRISTQSNLEGTLGILQVLIQDGSTQPTQPHRSMPSKQPAESESSIEGQVSLAKIVHLIDNEDNDVQLKLLQTARKAYAEGQDRTRFTTPAFVTAYLKLARRYKASQPAEAKSEPKKEEDDSGLPSQQTSQTSQLWRQTLSLLSNLYARVSSTSDLCLRLYLSCGQIADQCGNEEVSYECFAQAFTIYEEAISDSRAQFQAVCCIAGALHTTRGFSRENYDTLITKCALHGSKLLKKPDQCQAVYLASHLWWGVEIGVGREDGEEKDLYRDGKRVLECLQRALRVADACMDAGVSIKLFVEILNRYVYYYDQQNEAVTVKYLNGLIELIHSNLATASSEGGANLEGPKKHFERTLEYIRSRDFEGVHTEAK